MLSGDLSRLIRRPPSERPIPYQCSLSAALLVDLLSAGSGLGLTRKRHAAAPTRSKGPVLHLALDTLNSAGTDL